jgi:hypothetical protein
MLGIYQLTSCLASLCVATLCSLIGLWYSCGGGFHLGGIFFQHEYDLSGGTTTVVAFTPFEPGWGHSFTSGGDSCGTSLGESMVVEVH